MPMKGTSLRNKSRAKISCRKSRAMQYSSNGSLVLDMAAGRIDRWKDQIALLPSFVDRRPFRNSRIFCACIDREGKCNRPTLPNYNATKVEGTQHCWRSKWQLHVVQAGVRSTDRHILEKGFQACNGSNPGIPTTLIFGTHELQYMSIAICT